MTSVILQSLCLGTTIIGYQLGGDPLISMFCIGWCSAFVLVSVIKAISKEVRR